MLGVFGNILQMTDFGKGVIFKNSISVQHGFIVSFIYRNIKSAACLPAKASDIEAMGKLIIISTDTLQSLMYAKDISRP